jgi:hypothetical protein
VSALTFHSVSIYPEKRYFTWRCLKCGRGFYGVLADEPVSGWDEPRWKLSGPLKSPTLEPSLGCRGLQDDSCSGHFFFREGKLEEAT